MQNINVFLINNIYFKINKFYLLYNNNLSFSYSNLSQILGKNGIGKSILIKICTKLNIKKRGYSFNNNNNNTIAILSINSNIKVNKISNFITTIIQFTYNNISSTLIYLYLYNLYNKLNINIRFLSSGELNNLKIIHFLINNSYFWVLDEPFNNLDINNNTILSLLLKNHLFFFGNILLVNHINNIKCYKINNISYLNL